MNHQTTPTTQIARCFSGENGDNMNHVPPNKQYEFRCQPQHSIYCQYVDELKEQLETATKMYVYEQNANEPLRNKINELKIELKKAQKLADANYQEALMWERCAVAAQAREATAQYEMDELLEELDRLKLVEQDYKTLLNKWLDECQNCQRNARKYTMWRITKIYEQFRERRRQRIV